MNANEKMNDTQCTNNTANNDKAWVDDALNYISEIRAEHADVDDTIFSTTVELLNLCKIDADDMDDECDIDEDVIYEAVQFFEGLDDSLDTREELEHIINTLRIYAIYSLAEDDMQCQAMEESTCEGEYYLNGGEEDGIEQSDLPDEVKVKIRERYHDTDQLISEIKDDNDWTDGVEPELDAYVAALNLVRIHLDYTLKEMHIYIDLYSNCAPLTVERVKTLLGLLKDLETSGKYSHHAERLSRLIGIVESRYEDMCKESQSSK